MGRTKKKLLDCNEAMKSFNTLLEEQPLLPFAIPLLLVLWAIEKWFFSPSNWVLLGLAVWTTIQYGSYQRRNIVEDLNKKWMQMTLEASPVTPLEHCEWLNKLLIEVWSNYINPKLSLRFASIVERRFKHRKSMLIEKIELRGFSLGSRPPLLGLHGTRWATSGDQRFMRVSFDWDTDDVNIMLFAKLAKPLMGTARIAVNSIHIKGDVCIDLLVFLRLVDARESQMSTSICFLYCYHFSHQILLRNDVVSDITFRYGLVNLHPVDAREIIDNNWINFKFVTGARLIACQSFV